MMGESNTQVMVASSYKPTSSGISRLSFCKGWPDEKGGGKCKDGEDKSNVRQEMVVTKREVGRGKEGGKTIYERN